MDPLAIDSAVPLHRLNREAFFRSLVECVIPAPCKLA
jgi:hypothetical protein